MSKDKSKLSVVVRTPQQCLVSRDDIDLVSLTVGRSEIAILPGHTPLVASVSIAPLMIRAGDEEQSLAVSGGFIKVESTADADAKGGTVEVLAEAAEKREEIDTARAQRARGRAEELLAERPDDLDLPRAEAALARACVRLKVAGNVETD